MEFCLPRSGEDPNGFTGPAWMTRYIMVMTLSRGRDWEMVQKLNYLAYFPLHSKLELVL